MGGRIFAIAGAAVLFCSLIAALIVGHGSSSSPGVTTAQQLAATPQEAQQPQPGYTPDPNAAWNYIRDHYGVQHVGAVDATGKHVGYIDLSEPQTTLSNGEHVNVVHDDATGAQVGVMTGFAGFISNDMLEQATQLEACYHDAATAERDSPPLSQACRDLMVQQGVSRERADAIK